MMNLGPKSVPLVIHLSPKRVSYKEPSFTGNISYIIQQTCSLDVKFKSTDYYILCDIFEHFPHVGLQREKLEIVHCSLNV